MNKIRIGDNVKVICGKDKGKKGKVLYIDRVKHRIIVEGVNFIKKHIKPTSENQKGGIVKKESFIDISNVMYLYNNKPVRIGFKKDGDKKVRFVKQTGDILK